MPVADSFSDASLYVYHYVPAEAKTSGWVVAEKAQALGGLDYQLDLGEEPEVSVFLPLRLDTSVEVQNVRFELAGLRSNEIVAEVRARQYGVGSDSEEYQSLTDWRRLDNGEMSLGVPVNKTAVSKGGRTVVEWRFRAVSGAIVGGNIINMKAIITKAVVWVAENRVVWTCEEKDNYRFGFNGQEKDNEVRGLGNSMDYNARMYDTRLGRFPTLDPWAGKYPSQSPYAAFNDNPVYFVDPTGKGGIAYLEGNKIRVSAVIYVYSSTLTQEQVNAATPALQKSVNDFWNRPASVDADGNATPQIAAVMMDGKRTDINFQIRLEAVTPERAKELAKGNDDQRVNFMNLFSAEPTQDNSSWAEPGGNGIALNP